MIWLNCFGKYVGSGSTVAGIVGSKVNDACIASSKSGQGMLQ